MAGDTILWNPASIVGVLFISESRIYEILANKSAGLGEVIADDIEVDVQVFAEFVDALVNLHESSNHMIYRTLMRGFLGTALALLLRTGSPAPASIGDDTGELMPLAALLDRKMPT
jgi:hypothetical protein